MKDIIASKDLELANVKDEKLKEKLTKFETEQEAEKK